MSIPSPEFGAPFHPVWRPHSMRLAAPNHTNGIVIPKLSIQIIAIIKTIIAIIRKIIAIILFQAIILLPQSYTACNRNVADL